LLDESLHLNSAGDLPPVDCPLLILIKNKLWKARRPTFVSRKDNALVYQLPSGRQVTGRFKWTYP
jgi:hypothetical protein